MHVGGDQVTIWGWRLIMHKNLLQNCTTEDVPESQTVTTHLFWNLFQARGRLQVAVVKEMAERKEKRKRKRSPSMPS